LARGRKKIPAYVFWIIKAAIFIASIWYIFYKLKNYPDTGKFFGQFQDLEQTSLLLLSSVMILMFINWGIESAKWKKLVSKLQPISFFRSYQAVWSGLTINNWIPNRIAEFLGRILFLKSGNRLKAIFSTFIGSYSQFYITVLAGTIGLIFWVKSLPLFHFTMMILGLIAINALLLFGLFRMNVFTGQFSKIRLIRRLEKYYLVLGLYNRKEKLGILSLSAIRYIVYLLQYYLLFKAFGVEVSPGHGFIIISLVFITQAVIPSVTLTEIGIRGATVIYFAGRYSDNLNGMLSAAFLIWFINIILPTIVGAFFILALKIKKVN
jgi:hypothetical protein